MTDLFMLITSCEVKRYGACFTATRSWRHLKKTYHIISHDVIRYVNVCSVQQEQVVNFVASFPLILCLLVLAMSPVRRK